MDARAIAFANNDIAYIWWALPKKIPQCLGFSVRRIDSHGVEKPPPALVGFEPGLPGQPHEMRDTDVWPVQAFQWKDVFSPAGVYRYRIVPMLGPDPKALVPDEANALVTSEAHLTGAYGDIEAYSNVGPISTQAITKTIKGLVGSKPGYTSSTEVLRGEIAREGSEIRRRLAGQVLNKGVLSLLRSAKVDGGTCTLGLYELTDRQLINAVESLAGSGQLELCLSNADSSREYTGADGKKHTEKIKDGTNKDARAELHGKHVPLNDRFVPSSSIGHNKFVVWSHDGTPTAVLTGSTNWTSTGLCSQTNNALVIHNSTVATDYLDCWQRLLPTRH